MKKLIYILSILLLTTIAHGEPFIICDPNPDATSYEITGDITATPPAEPDGSIKYDLAGISTQLYNLEFKSCNEWGCSTPVPFQFEKKLPASSTGFRLSNQ